jgi:hypothetical protein
MKTRTALRTSFCIACLLLIATAAHAQLQGASGVTTISDYPALATKVQPEQLAMIRTVARNVVLTASVSTAVLVEVIGHADFDSRGRAFEQAVSENRADNAAAILLHPLGSRHEVPSVSAPEERGRASSQPAGGLRPHHHPVAGATVEMYGLMGDAGSIVAARP